jgi:LPXTG-motif cell wall-anchored protein
MTQLTRPVAITATVLVLTMAFLSAFAQAAPLMLTSSGSALGQVRAAAATVSAQIVDLLPSTSTQMDLSLIVVGIGLAIVLAVFALARRYQVR